MPLTCDVCLGKPQSRIVIEMRSFFKSSDVPPLAPSATVVTEVDNSGAEALLLAYVRGDGAAFNRLFAQFERPVYRYLLRHVRVAAKADELFQEIWLAVIRHAAQYEPQGRFESWLFTIAHHRLMDHFREQGANLETISIETEHDDGDGAAFVELAASPVEQPEARAFAREQAQMFLKLIEALPMVQREAFLLQEEAGMSLVEIAQATGVGVETVKSRLRYAMSKLRSGMEGWR